MDDIQRQFDQNNDEHKTLMKEIKELGKGLEDIKLSLTKLPQELIELFDNRYASKRIETTIYWLGGVLFTALVGLGVFIVERLIQ